MDDERRGVAQFLVLATRLAPHLAPRFGPHLAPRCTSRLSTRRALDLHPPCSPLGAWAEQLWTVLHQPTRRYAQRWW